MNRTLRITYSLSFMGLLVGLGAGRSVAWTASPAPGR